MLTETAAKALAEILITAKGATPDSRFTHIAAGKAVAFSTEWVGHGTQANPKHCAAVTIADGSNHVT